MGTGIPSIHGPGELTNDELAQVVEKIQSILWKNPACPAETEWNADTTDKIADVLINAGLGPTAL